MVDLNVSILHGVKCDETDYNLAVETIKEAFNNGIKRMVLVGKQGTEESNLSIYDMQNRISIMEEKLDERRINVKLYLGQIIKLSENNLKDCLNGKYLNVNGSKYMLVDLDGTMTDEQVDMIFELTLIGIVPIILYPERCKEIVENIKKIHKLKELGCLFELGINSLKGKYGNKTKKVAKKLLKGNEYDFVSNEISEQIKKEKKYGYRSLSKSQKETFKNNALKVLRNEDIPNSINVKKKKKPWYKLAV